MLSYSYLINFMRVNFLMGIVYNLLLVVGKYEASSKKRKIHENA